MAEIIYVGPASPCKDRVSGRLLSFEQIKNAVLVPVPDPIPLPIETAAHALALVALLEANGPLDIDDITRVLPFVESPRDLVVVLVSSGAAHLSADGRLVAGCAPRPRRSG